MNKGYQLIFYTEQNRTHHHQPIGEWLFELVRSMKIRGATLTTGVEGIGHDHRVHLVHFFDVTEQPVVVTMVVSEEECTRLLTHIRGEVDLQLFYVKMPVEFGSIGEDGNSD